MQPDAKDHANEIDIATNDLKFDTISNFAQELIEAMDHHLKAQGSLEHFPLTQTLHR